MAEEVADLLDELFETVRAERDSLDPEQFANIERCFLAIDEIVDGASNAQLAQYPGDVEDIIDIATEYLNK